MNRVYSFCKLPAMTFLASQLLLSVPAFAAGYQINEISPSLQGDATAGAAAANNDVTTMFTNPATLSTLIENQAYLGGSEIIPHFHMSNATAIHTVNVPGIPASNITAPVAGTTSQSSIAKSAFVPDAYFGWRYNNRWVAGIAVVAPFGLTTSYDNSSVLRFAADNSSVATVNITPAISYMINEQWSLGLGFQAQYMQASFSNFNGPYTGVPILDGFLASTNATYAKGSAWGYGYTVGALFQPDVYTRLGIGFRSQISEQLKGDGRQFTSPGGIVPAPSGAFLFNAASSDNAAIKTPAVLTFSAARDINNLTLKASAQYNGWDSFNQLTVNMPSAFATSSTIHTQWRNTWLAAVGADYRVTSAWTVRTGVAYDQTPTSDTYRDPRIPDADRVWLALGTSYKINNHFALDGGYTHIFIPDHNVNVTQAIGTSATSTVPLEVNQVHAHYTGAADIVAVGVRYSF